LREHSVGELDLGYAGAEPGERLGELAAHRSAADYHQAFGQVTQVPYVLVGQALYVGQPLDRGQHGSSTSCENYLAGRDSATVHLHRVRVNERRAAGNYVDAIGAQAFGRLVGGDIGDDRMHPVHYPAQVDGLISDGQPVTVASPVLLGHFCSFKQRLGRHAARPGAVAAQPALLDYGHLRAKLYGEPGRRQSGRTSANY